MDFVAGVLTVWAPSYNPIRGVYTLYVYTVYFFTNSLIQGMGGGRANQRED
jgi:hypothetical protein